MNSITLKGLGTALVTPFTSDGSVDLNAVRTLAERQIANNVDFLVPCGTTGEAVTLNNDEFESVVANVVEVAAGRVPVVAGAGSNSTAVTIEQCRIALQCKVDALLVVGPYYNKPTQEGFYQHFKTVSEAVKAPIVMYNVPGRTGSNITAETQLRIAELDYLIATKEASGNLSQNMAIVNGKPDGFSVLSGDDNLALAQIAVGLDGVISVGSNEIPKEVADMVHAAVDGDYVSARSIHYRILNLLEGNFLESNPITVKTAMAMMGLIEEQFRLPLVPMQEANKKKLKVILQELGLV
jgi:4-hydroxy-tetrahydrodipicolinate synthase